jgi:hypothetical protein
MWLGALMSPSLIEALIIGPRSFKPSSLRSSNSGIETILSLKMLRHQNEHVILLTQNKFEPWLILRASFFEPLAC